MPYLMIGSLSQIEGFRVFMSCLIVIVIVTEISRKGKQGREEKVRMTEEPPLEETSPFMIVTESRNNPKF